MAKRGKTARPAGRKPETPREALAEVRAALHTVVLHLRETLKEYRAHKPRKLVAGDDVEAYVAARWQRDTDVRRLRRFVGALEAYLSGENKKTIGRLLGLERGPGRPGGRKTGKSLDRARKISERRETESEIRKNRQGKPARRMWKEIGRDFGISPQAARQLLGRELQNLAESDAKQFAKEFAARLNQHFKQKPPQVGTAKARSAALGKKLRAQNRRKR
jgi:histone H3/H4